ncbi:PHD finger protein EHD3 isoform X1 [Lycium barbarum]|uniref:PHD finger protein EHD3 isoform X1 n=1 Tax=Lycium barbarum TaxID=112863 RepID=UPI00293E1FA4|nr:PHD finger protein EHD3 isoform X1 [Lycium barbarum]XP_060198363.1 PHD finger protein EHD3 isoform X1 [Lycium barbarum]
MVGEDKGDSDGAYAILGLSAENGQTVKKLKGPPVKVENGDTDTNAGGSSGNVCRTYKRRKRMKVVENGNVPGHSSGQSSNKSMNEPLDTALNKSSCTQASVDHVKPPGLLNDSSYGLVRNWKAAALKQMFQSLESDGGLKGCIQEALASHSEAGCAVEAKESGKCCADGNRCSPPSQFVSQGIQNGTKTVSNGSVDEPKSCTATELCQHMFLDIVKSEKFAQLCHVLFENFEGMKADKVFDISLIHSRMKDGSYEGSSLLFHSDIQQLVAKMEQAETYGVNKRCACQCCGEKADGTDSLACDSCEEIYHVSCVEPIVKDIPLRSWYCAKCTAKGIESPHDNCVVCERLNASRSVIIEDVVEDLTSEDMLLDLEESASGLEDEEKLSEGVGDLPHCCNICKTEVRSDEDFRECGHPFCPHKYYHERCLTRKQLDVYGPCWYCPSCLCRACLKDCDDDKIVLCDGCDHAYHIFCMQPPQTSIPSGKWFCKKCNVQIQRIHKAKRTFETLQNELKKKNEQCAGLGVPKGKNEEGSHKSGGVEMLLNAAKTLNCQEESAALGSKDR